MSLVLGIVLVVALVLAWFAVRRARTRHRARSAWLEARTGARGDRVPLDGQTTSARSEMRAAEDTSAVAGHLARGGRTARASPTHRSAR